MPRSGNTIKTDTAREYRKKHGADMPTKKLARIMREENKLIFDNIEDARTTLRYIEGKHGKKNRKRIGKMAGEFIMKEARPLNPYNLPESDEEPYEPYILKGHKRVLVIGDIHIPYHSMSAITATFDFAKKEKPDAVFLNGDIIDCHKVSYFLKDPRKKRFSEELDMFKEFFKILQKTFKCKIYYKFGNHEVRYDNYLFEKAHELKGVEEFELCNIIKARAEGIEVIEDDRIVVMNGLPFVHGHEFGKRQFTPVNAARGLFLQSKHSAVKGDCHNTSEHPEPDIFGKLMVCYSVGCLCGLTPKWLRINKWNWGFAFNDLSSNGKEYQFRNYKILRDTLRVV